MDIDYYVVSTEDMVFSDNSFDVITACQCFWYFDYEEFTLKIPFTRESWNGRIKACRGIGASLSKKEISMWEQEHRKLLEHIAPNEFDILYYDAITELKRRKISSYLAIR